MAAKRRLIGRDSFSLKMESETIGSAQFDGGGVEDEPIANGTFQVGKDTPSGFQLVFKANTEIESDVRVEDLFFAVEAIAEIFARHLIDMMMTQGGQMWYAINIAQATNEIEMEILFAKEDVDIGINVDITTGIDVGERGAGRDGVGLEDTVRITTELIDSGAVGSPRIVADVTNETHHRSERVGEAGTAAEFVERCIERKTHSEWVFGSRVGSHHRRKRPDKEKKECYFLHRIDALVTFVATKIQRFCKTIISII